MPAPIATVEEFYAHALAIEREAAERYAEFAEHFEDRGEEAIAGLCRNLAKLELDHFAELAAVCSEMTLPAIADGEYRWLDIGSPEAPAHELIYRVATPRHLLEIALKAEWRAREFFIWIARTAPARSVRELAAVMAAEEMEHVGWDRQALEYLGATQADWEALLAEGLGPGSVTQD
jgi:rubrerythrin